MRGYGKNRIFGELITANLYALRKGAEGCEVVNYYDENAATVRIALDKTLTPAQNAQKYYKKYNKQKRTLAAVAPQKEEAESDLDYTESMLSALSRAENTLDLTEIEQELRDTGILPPEKKKVKNAPVVPFRVFAVGKFRIFAGRNNVQNDRLLREAPPTIFGCIRRNITVRTYSSARKGVKYQTRYFSSPPRSAPAFRTPNKEIKYPSIIASADLSKSRPEQKRGL